MEEKGAHELAVLDEDKGEHGGDMEACRAPLRFCEGTDERTGWTDEDDARMRGG